MSKNSKPQNSKPVDSEKSFLKRVLFILIIIGLCFFVAFGRLFYIQIVKGEKYSAKASSQQLSDKETQAMRGTIYDSDGNVLAQSATVWIVFVDAKNIESEEDRNLIVNFFSDIFEYDEEEKKDLYEKCSTENRYIVVEKKVDNIKKEKIAEFVSENKFARCIGFQQSAQRYYPYNDLASTVIGFTGADNQGLGGIESYYNDELTGTNGRTISLRDSIGNPISDDYETSIEAKDGNSLVLTINSTIQYYLEKELKDTLEEYQAKGCYGVVMNCKTGEVIAMASLPDYNCNDPYKITYDKYLNDIKRQKTKEDKLKLESEFIQRQWRNFTVSDTYVPGSVFKTFIASAALEENVVNLNTTYTCGGSIKVEDYVMKCHKHDGHGTQTLTQGLENSCNPFFITIGQKLGVHNYFKYFEGFGFTQKTGIDLPGEAKPQFYKENQYGIVEISSASFGQTNSVTPIQMCAGLSAIANGGVYMKPYVVSEIKDEDGNTVSKTEPTKVRQIISKDTSKKVCNMMRSVVDNGTGKNAYVPGYAVGGKTGTSTKLGESKAGEKDKYIVSFAAIAPSDDPQIAMLIICDEPNKDLGGGAICAPIASVIIEKAMNVYGIEPKYSKKEAKKLSIKTPNVVNKNINDAKANIKNSNLKVEVVGNGKKVLKQSPSYDESIPIGGKVVLYTEDVKQTKVSVPNFENLTVSQANKLASDNNLNIKIAGNDSNKSNVIAYKQSIKAGKKVDIGTVITVTFKSTQALLD